MTSEEPTPYRVLRVVGTPSYVELFMNEDFDEPDSELALLWRDNDDTDMEVFRAHWRGKDYRVLNINHSGTDYTRPERAMTVVTMVPWPAGYQPTTLVG